ncbi:hypothetical protein KAU37_11065, partial [Candidatus Bipolaricaulota bacterium]|nr:hypothetical protein [Candidatus Bipolaricaulota bacterium]
RRTLCATFESYVASYLVYDVLPADTGQTGVRCPFHTSIIRSVALYVRRSLGGHRFRRYGNSL